MKDVQISISVKELKIVMETLDRKIDYALERGYDRQAKELNDLQQKLRAIETKLRNDALSKITPA